jgi:hypothetical protein
VNNELEGIWEKDVVAYFKVVAEYVPVRTEESHEKLGNSNWKYSEYKSESLPFDPTWPLTS